MTRLALASLVGTLLAIPNADAGGCYVQSAAVQYATQTYQAAYTPAYATPVLPAVFVPVASYTLGMPAQAATAAAPAPAVAPAAAEPAPDLSAKLDTIITELASQRADINALKASRHDYPAYPQTPQIAPQAPAYPTPQAAPRPPVAEPAPPPPPAKIPSAAKHQRHAPAATTDMTSAVGWNTLKTECATCHTGSKAKGGFTLNLTNVTAQDRAKILTAVFSGTMPPRKPLDDRKRNGIVLAIAQ